MKFRRPHLGVALLALLTFAAPGFAQMNWREYRADALHDLVREILADADTRASLQDSNLTAGHNGHFFLADAAGGFRMEISGQLQNRFVLNLRDDSGDDDGRGGFDIRRAKISFDGHLGDPTFEYKISLDLLDEALSDGYVLKQLDDGWSLKVGQFKPPFLREALNSSKRLLAVERSLVGDQSVWNQGRSLGLELQYAQDAFHAIAALHNGFRNDNVIALEEDTEFALTARGEWLLAGSWRQLRDYSSRPDDPFAALIGTAVAYEVDEYGTLSGPEEERLSWTADLSIEGGGANAFVAVITQQADRDGGTEFDRYGVVVQGGVLVADDLECFIRYEYGDLDEPGEADLSVITAGFTRFFSGHNLKWQTDVGYGLNEVDDAWARSSAGWQADAPGEDGQVVIRTKIQLLF